jgi:hypothetical protein
VKTSETMEYQYVLYWNDGGGGGGGSSGGSGSYVRVMLNQL